MELNLRILQNKTNFKDLEKKFKIVCKEAETKQLDFFRDGLIPDDKNRDRKEIKHLFVEADGIHISLQTDDKEKGKLKLGMSYQGWKRDIP